MEIKLKKIFKQKVIFKDSLFVDLDIDGVEVRCIYFESDDEWRIQFGGDFKMKSSQIDKFLKRKNEIQNAIKELKGLKNEK